MSGERHAVLLSGAGRYADPWHPFAETSARLAELLNECGYVVTTRTDVDEALAEGMTDAELLVVNIGLPRDGAAAPTADGRRGLAGYLDTGRPILAVHAAVTSLIDAPQWRRALGGTWIRGVSMHPPHGSARVRLAPHPLLNGMTDFELSDERYSFLRTAEGRI